MKGRQAEPVPMPAWPREHREPLRRADGLIVAKDDGESFRVGFALGHAPGQFILLAQGNLAAPAARHLRHAAVRGRGVDPDHPACHATQEFRDHDGLLREEP